MVNYNHTHILHGYGDTEPQIFLGVTSRLARGGKLGVKVFLGFAPIAAPETRVLNY